MDLMDLSFFIVRSAAAARRGGLGADPPASCGSARPRVNAAQTRIERFISSQHKSSWTLLTLDVFGSARAALGTATWLCPRCVNGLVFGLAEPKSGGMRGRVLCALASACSFGSAQSASEWPSRQLQSAMPDSYVGSVLLPTAAFNLNSVIRSSS